MSARRRKVHRLRHWHRWLGMGSLVFVVLLSVTGIVLNHSADLGLDRSHVGARWLLNWYGIEVPPVAASYAVGGHRVTLIGQRLYFDDHELADGVLALQGAVAVPPVLAVAVHDSVLLLTRSGNLIERMPLAGALSGGVEAIGTAQAALLVRAKGGLYRADEELLGFAPCTDVADADIRWSAPSPVPDDALARLHDAYRGTGITVERLIADIHSGRLFTRAGPIVMDLVAVTLIALSAFGMLLWARRSPRGRTRR